MLRQERDPQTIKRLRLLKIVKMKKRIQRITPRAVPRVIQRAVQRAAQNHHLKTMMILKMFWKRLLKHYMIHSASEWLVLAVLHMRMEMKRYFPHMYLPMTIHS